MTMITQAMRRVLAGDEATRALDPNGLRLRSSARVPRAVRARNPANGVLYQRPAPLAGDVRAAARMKADCETLMRALDAAIGVEQPTPYVRVAVPDDAVWPQVMRGFA